MKISVTLSEGGCDLDRLLVEILGELRRKKVEFGVVRGFWIGDFCEAGDGRYCGGGCWRTRWGEGSG